jgi:hypothetical protein
MTIPTWATSPWFLAPVVFTVTAINDVVWTKYIRRTGEGKAKEASHWAALTFVFAGVSFNSYLEHRWLFLVAAAGAWVGTYYSVKREADEKAKEVRNP